MSDATTNARAELDGMRRSGRVFSELPEDKARRAELHAIIRAQSGATA